MARASIPTLLSLDRFAQIAGLHPLHFNQIYVTDLAPTVQCDSTLRQHSWQMQGGVSREELALAIAEAEIDIEAFLGYSPGPRYYEAIYDLVKSYRAFTGPVYDLITTKHGFIQAGGVRATTLIQAGASISFSDTDLDGYEETATVTVTVLEGQLADQIQVFYPDKDADPTWRIRPATVSISNTTATITFKREQAVLPELLDTYSTEESGAVDGADDNNFLDSVDVYKVYCDPSDQGTLYYQPGCVACYGSNGTCQICSWTSQALCMRIVTARIGTVSITPGNYDADLGYYVAAPCINGYPRKARLKYLAGADLQPNGEKMQTLFELAIARLAMNKLDRPICGCNSVQANFEYWNTDMSQSISDSGSSASRVPGQHVIDNPFGPMRAGVWVYNVLRNIRMVL